MLRPWESYRKKRHAGLIEKTSCNPSCSSFSNSGETSMPRKRKMRGTARAAQERDPPDFLLQFFRSGNRKRPGWTENEASTLKSNESRKANESIPRFRQNGPGTSMPACSRALPVERHPWAREGKFHDSPSFFLFPLLPATLFR